MSEQETQNQNQEQDKPKDTTPAEKPLTKKELEALLRAHLDLIHNHTFNKGE